VRLANYLFKEKLRRFIYLETDVKNDKNTGTVGT
jgi:hypothetical protein